MQEVRPERAAVRNGEWAAARGARPRPVPFCVLKSSPAPRPSVFCRGAGGASPCGRGTGVTGGSRCPPRGEPSGLCVAEQALTAAAGLFRALRARFMDVKRFFACSPKRTPDGRQTVGCLCEEG